ncbi:MAG: hypothetical protein MUF18_07545 [Fimbriiglobus sp.]|jgi:hypothetical protein|nr:hypothetical protein [Fimbriiglobus sp.]
MTAPAPFADLRDQLTAAGPLAAADALCDRLRQAEDFQALFYALLLKKRVQLGVSPFPTGPAADLPESTHAEYEQAIREAGREVGGIYLKRNDLFKAWGFFRMLGEPEPVRAALEAYTPGEDDDIYGVVDIAWQQGVHPTKGFDLVLTRSGICSAITMVGGADLSRSPDVRDYCVKGLVRALHAQLKERLTGDLTGRGVSVPADVTVRELIAGRDFLFADDSYHIDTSHLSSVVQFAMHLPPCPEHDLAAELCEYGAKLSPNLQGDTHPPFENGYADYRVYLGVVADHDREAGIAHFQAKLPAAKEMGNTLPAEVLVNLLLKIDRLPQAVAVAREHLADVGEQELSCPPLAELARRAKDYPTLAAAAERSGDAVTFLAGLIAGTTSGARG